MMSTTFKDKPISELKDDELNEEWYNWDIKVRDISTYSRYGSILQIAIRFRRECELEIIRRFKASVATSEPEIAESIVAPENLVKDMIIRGIEADYSTAATLNLSEFQVHEIWQEVLEQVQLQNRYSSPPQIPLPPTGDDIPADIVDDTPADIVDDTPTPTPTEEQE